MEHALHLSNVLICNITCKFFKETLYRAKLYQFDLQQVLGIL